MLMYVRGVVLLRNFPLWGRIDLPYKRELESGQYVLTGSSEKKKLISTSRRKHLLSNSKAGVEAG